MSQKRIGFGEALDNLIEKTGLSEEPAFMEKSETNFQEELEANAGVPMLAGQSVVQAVISDTEYIYPYLQSAYSSQAREDIRQSNETIAEMVTVGMNGCLVLRKNCRNSRLRDVYLTLKNHDFQVFKYKTDESDEEIIKIVFFVNGKGQEIWGKRSGVSGRKMYRKLQQEGVEFNLALCERRQMNGIRDFICQLILDAVPQPIPQRHGWYKMEEFLKFHNSNKTWEGMEKKCSF